MLLQSKRPEGLAMVEFQPLSAIKWKREIDFAIGDKN